MKAPVYFKQADSIGGFGQTAGPWGSADVTKSTGKWWVKLTSLNSAPGPPYLPSYCWTQVVATPGGQYDTSSTLANQLMACASGSCTCPTYYQPAGLVYAPDGNANLCADGATPIVEIAPRGTIDDSGRDEWIIANNPTASSGIEVIGGLEGSGDVTGVTSVTLDYFDITDDGGGAATGTINDASYTTHGVVNLTTQTFSGTKNFYTNADGSTGSITVGGGFGINFTYNPVTDTSTWNLGDDGPINVYASKNPATESNTYLRMRCIFSEGNAATASLEAPAAFPFPIFTVGTSDPTLSTYVVPYGCYLEGSLQVGVTGMDANGDTLTGGIMTNFGTGPSYDFGGF
jgi:hypothetical protein